MRKRCFPVIIILIVLTLVTIECAEGSVSVGVKVGDWIQYEVTTTGNPPPEHNVKSARMDIIEVKGPEITVNVTTEANNGTISSSTLLLNLETGQIGAWFIIPANLSIGDTFYDASMDQNVTIAGQEQLEYAGAVRTVTNATVPGRIKQWDRATGVFVKAVDTLQGYSLNAIATETNMWTAQIPGFDLLILLAIVVAVAFVIFVLILILFIRRGRQEKSV